jgi:hypothetical protein
MPSVFETAGQDDNGQAATLLSGLQVLAQDETIAFRRYVRNVLPLDGYVFWLGANTLEVKGSLHYTTDKRQNEDETIGVNRVILSTANEIQNFNELDPDMIWVGEYKGLRFAFSQQSSRFKTGVFHYFGYAVYPAMESQLVDVGSQLSPDNLIVSNSLPAWLSLFTYNPIWVQCQIPNPFVPLFPSFAVPDNLRPPYGAVHIDPGQTRAIQAFPALGRVTTSQSQLATDTVTVTLYGLTNSRAMDFVSLVNQFSEDTDLIGMMDIAIARDEKRTQAELGILAMKKSIRYQVSYNQGAMRNVARALIEKASAAVEPQPLGA